MARPARRLRSVPDKPAGAVLYVRVSALMGRGGDDFHSPALQVEAMRRMVGSAGLREVDVVDDIDVSGQSFSRQGIERIRAMVEARQVDVVALYDLSRLGRDLAESLTFIKWLRQRGVAVMSTKERIDDSPEGQFMLSQFLGLAELYGRQVGRRWSEIITRRAREGRMHGRLPLGYLRVDFEIRNGRPRGGRVVVDPILGPAVTEVFRRYAAGNDIGEIARWFSGRREVTTPRNRIKYILSNPIYLGHVHVGDWQCAPPDRDDKPWHGPPRLVTDEVWAKVRARAERDSRTPPRRLAPAYSLTGLVWCGEPGCRRRANVWPSRKGKNHPIILRLTCRRMTEGTQTCKGFGVPPLADVEAFVLDELRRHLALLRGDPTTRANTISKAVAAGADVARVRAALGETRQAMTELTVQLARQRVAEDLYDRTMADLRIEEARHLDQLDELAVAAEAPRTGERIVLVAELLRLWPDLTEPERNRALRGLGCRVTIRRARRSREPMHLRANVDFE